MKRFLLITILCLTALIGYGQNVGEEVGQDPVEVSFDVLVSKNTTLTANQQSLLKTKLEAAVARANFGGNGKSPFVIVPAVSFGDAKTAENSISPITIVNGELTLIVKNRIDGKTYNELTIPLKTSQPITSKKDNVSLLIEAINIRDKRIVRFLKVSRKRIADSKTTK